ncbi:MAG: PQQ-binding-like beta-propeller repeat protein, partial [Gemmatimonadota bacterium]|nr:PQQ-binding-like beta-propeller repeat protein [Gemmatimonadota bacterium]
MILFFLIFYLFFIPVHAEEWSRFRGDAQSTGVANSSLPAELDVLWMAQIEIGIESTAAIWQDAVYVGGLDEKLYAFDFDSGVSRWTYSATGEIKSSPLVFEKTVFFGDGNGVFHAVDAQTGKALWTFQTDGEIVSSANATGGRVLFGSY